MVTFKISVANKTIEINTLHTRTKAICRDFTTAANADFEVSVTQEDIDKNKNSNEVFDTRIREQWDGLVEVSVVLQKICDELIEHGTLMLHGAAIAVDGGAYVFSGKSGVGKSTHIRLWQENRPDTIVINGDKPFIVTDDTPTVYGSPWAGKETIYSNVAVPLKAIILMERSDNNSITPLSFEEAFIPMLEQIYHPMDELKMRKTVQMLQTLKNRVSFYRFQVNNFKEDCFEVAYNYLHH